MPSSRDGSIVLGKKGNFVHWQNEIKRKCDKMLEVIRCHTVSNCDSDVLTMKPKMNYLRRMASTGSEFSPLAVFVCSVCHEYNLTLYSLNRTQCVLHTHTYPTVFFPGYKTEKIIIEKLFCDLYDGSNNAYNIKNTI